MKQEIKELHLNNSVFLKGAFLYQEGSKGILLHKDVVNEKYHVIIENPIFANRDQFFVLDKKEFSLFSERKMEDKLKKDFPNIEVVHDRYKFNSDGDIEENVSYQVNILNNGKVVARLNKNMVNDQEKIDVLFFDNKFKSDVYAYWFQNNESAKKMFKHNFIDINRELTTKDTISVFVDYITQSKNAVRSFDEQLAHKYISLNGLDDGIIKRLVYKEELVKKHFPLIDLQLGKIYKVDNDLDMGEGKKVKKGDFYQIVKSWNKNFYFELVNIDENNNKYRENKAIIFNSSIKNASKFLREITKIEETKLRRSSIISGLDFGEEVVFTHAKTQIVNGKKEELIPKGAKGVILDYDHKVRMLVFNEETKDIMYKDLYRSEVFKTTEKTGDKYEWLALPYTTSFEIQGKWFKELPMSMSRIYLNGDIVGELNSEGDIRFREEKSEKRFNSYVDDLFLDLDSNIKRAINFRPKEKKALVVNFLLKQQYLNKETAFEDYMGKIIKINENRKTIKLH